MCQMMWEDGVVIYFRAEGPGHLYRKSEVICCQFDWKLLWEQSPRDVKSRKVEVWRVRRSNI